MTLDTANGQPDDQSMDSRLAKVEEDLVAIKIELAVMKSQLGNCATKADLAELTTALAETKASIIIWVVSVFILSQVLSSLLSRLGL